MASLYGSKIIVGREETTSRLTFYVLSGSRHKQGYLDTAPRVPNSVSRLKINGTQVIGHCMISIDGQGNMSLKNMKVANRTFVDGLECYRMGIGMTSSIALGSEYYPIDLRSLLMEAERLTGAEVPAPEQKRYDITYLQYMWEDYEHERDSIHRRQRMWGIVASTGGVFSLGSLVIARSDLSVAGIDLNKLMTFMMLLALGITIFSVVMRMVDNSERKLRELNDRMMHEYNCPKCGAFLGMQPFFLVKNMGGHRCGAKW